MSIEGYSPVSPEIAANSALEANKKTLAQLLAKWQSLDAQQPALMTFIGLTGISPDASHLSAATPAELPAVIQEIKTTLPLIATPDNSTEINTALAQIDLAYPNLMVAPTTESAPIAAVETPAVAPEAPVPEPAPEQQAETLEAAPEPAPEPLAEVVSAAPAAPEPIVAEPPIATEPPLTFTSEPLSASDPALELTPAPEPSPEPISMPESALEPEPQPIPTPAPAEAPEPEKIDTALISDLPASSETPPDLVTDLPPQPEAAAAPEPLRPELIDEQELMNQLTPLENMDGPNQVSQERARADIKELDTMYVLKELVKTSATQEYLAAEDQQLAA